MESGYGNEGVLAVNMVNPGNVQLGKGNRIHAHPPISYKRHTHSPLRVPSGIISAE